MYKLVEDYQHLMDGLVDLSKLMSSEDPGVNYVSRLADESERFFITLLKTLSDDLKVDLFSKEDNANEQTQIHPMQ